MSRCVMSTWTSAWTGAWISVWVLQHMNRHSIDHKRIGTCSCLSIRDEALFSYGPGHLRVIFFGTILSIAYTYIHLQKITACFKKNFSCEMLCQHLLTRMPHLLFAFWCHVYRLRCGL